MHYTHTLNKIKNEIVCNSTEWNRKVVWNSVEWIKKKPEKNMYKYRVYWTDCTDSQMRHTHSASDKTNRWYLIYAKIMKNREWNE